MPLVCTAARREQFHLVVLAIGVNATAPVFRNLFYAHPRTETMAQDSLLIQSDHSRAQMESTVHVYFDRPRDLIFGALIPKGTFAAVSLLGRRIQRDSLREFLTVPEVTDVVGTHPPQLCGCRPRVAVALAKGYYADRFVAVGDSCITRLYKDGIGSALVTARAAANTAVFHGIGRSQFAAHYAPVCRAVAADNRYGRLVFGLVDHSKRNPIFMRGLGHALQSEAAKPPHRQVISQTLWALFTGDASYAKIFAMLFRPRSVARLARATVAALVARQGPERKV